MTNFISVKTEKMPQYKFVKIPKNIFKSDLSIYGKLLFIAMIERLSLSFKNKWKNKAGEVYIIMPCQKAMEILNCAKSTAVRTFSELEKNGFIRREHQGQGKPDMIYLNYKIMEENNNDVVSEKDLKKYECETSEGSNLKHAEVSETDSNNNNINKNNINKNKYPFIPFSHVSYEERKEYKEKIKFNVDYDTLIVERQKELIDEIIASMVNALCIEDEFIRIGKLYVPREEIKEKFLSMNQIHIEYIYDSMMKNTSSVKDMSSYLLTAIYRASNIINLHYRAMANHDMSQSRRY